MSSGILLIDKEEGMTSRKVDNLVGERFMTRKVGHLGTLDPFATGLLIVAVNKGTKYLTFLKDEEKTYQACLKLGSKTATGDMTSPVIEEKPVPFLEEGQIRNALRDFLGESEQIPPMTSAKKVDGEPLYKKAHKGIEIDRKPIKINVYEAELDDYERNEQIILFTVKVSKGTYIRTLGEDLAAKLGTVGHLVYLRRIAIGDISVDDAESIDKAEFVNIMDLLQHYEIHSVEHDKAKDIKDGKPLVLEAENDQVLIVDRNEPLAIYKRQEGDVFISERGLF